MTTKTTIAPSRNFARTKGTTRPHLRMALAMQAGCCDLCGGALMLDKAHSDHDHRNNLPRGALHKHCNAALGAFEGKHGGEQNVKALAAYLKRYLPNMRIGKLLPAIERYVTFWTRATDNQAALRAAYVQQGNARAITDEIRDAWRKAWQQFKQATAENPPSYGFSGETAALMRERGLVERPHGWVHVDPDEVQAAMLANIEHFGAATVREALALMTGDEPAKAAV
ncbi:endonuclease domain-containing protein [Paraburkholderia sp. MM5482-R1]|uniref:endonuclease domain-containing protein n=1 Tax=unclassified Paraburkholderia TaxID=2615204 RepID=UPI003D221D01